MIIYIYLNELDGVDKKKYLHIAHLFINSPTTFFFLMLSCFLVQVHPLGQSNFIFIRLNYYHRNSYLICRDPER